MKITKEINPNKVIRGIFRESVEIIKSGIYLVEITARAKSWWQNHLTTFFSDDGLYLKIDEIKLDRQGANWNGNSLRNLQQTIVFILHLSKGEHTLNLFPSHKPYLQSIKIYQADSNKIDFTPITNNPAEDGNRRPWYGFILLNLGLKKISITGSAKENKKIGAGRSDDDDLQLRINSRPIKNQITKSHKNWFWCGKVLKGQVKEFSQAVNLPVGWHFLELWADRSPKLEKVELEITDTPRPQPSPLPSKIQPYQKINGNDYNRFDQEILGAVDYWNGFFSKQEYPPTEPLGPNLVKSMIYIESRMGYGSGSNQPYPDVMQVWDEENDTPQTIKGLSGYPANEFITKTEYGHMKYSYPEQYLPPKVDIPQESIFWGVRWLYHKAQKFYDIGHQGKLDPPYVREWSTWKQAIMDYNNSDRKEEYQEEVWQLYKKGIGPEGEKLW